MDLTRLVALAALIAIAPLSRADVTFSFSQVNATTVALTTSGSLVTSGVLEGTDLFLPPLFVYRTDRNFFLLSGSGRHDRYRRSGQFLLQEAFTTGPFNATGSNASGDFIGIEQAGGNNPLFGLLVPTGYVSGAPLSGSQQFTGVTLSDLRLRAGTFTWTYGSTNTNSFIFQIPGNSVGGTITGLNDAVTLQLNGANNFTVTSNGAFNFPQELVFGDSYSVSVLQQPTGQTCTPTQGNGTISSDVSDVSITCVNNNYPVGGVVLGLASGETLVLQNNGVDDLVIGNNGKYQFATPLPFGALYSVSVLTQPASEVCTVLNGTGNVSTLTNNVIVNCAPATYSVSGSVTGLAAGETITLRNNGADDQTVTGPGTFTFSSQANNSAYAVTVASEPAGKTCAVSGGQGSIAGADVTGVSVTCTSLTYPVGGSVSGLVAGDSLVLQNNGGDDLILVANGSFTFATPLSSGASYDVTVLTQPPAPSETCVVSNGNGVMPVGGVSNVTVTCTVDTFPVSGDVSGLASGNSIALRLNGTDEQTLTGDGVFAFSPLADGTAYAVTIATQPDGQTCTVTDGSGTLSGASITNVAVSCVDNSYSVGGLLSGLVPGDTVVLQNNGGDNLTLTSDGAFAFSAPVNFRAPYAVSVLTQPAAPSETCTVSGGANNDGTGTMQASDVTNIAVVCTVNRFTVGGLVTGLAAGTYLVLQNNGAADLTLTADGNFTFPDQADGTAYTVTIGAQPEGQTCSVSNGAGTLAGASITNVAVSCVNDSYSVGGLLSGLVPGDTVVLQNNGGDDLTLTSDGAFAFSTPVSFRDPYAVTVLTQPPAPSETCTVSGGANNDGTGTMPAANVTSITIICTLNQFAVGGSLSGLASGTSLTLQNNGAADLTLTADGNFTFPDQADGSAFAITIAVQPDGQICTVNNGTGSLAGADVIDVSISCALLPAPSVPAVVVPVMPRWLMALTALLLMLLTLGIQRRSATFRR